MSRLIPTRHLQPSAFFSYTAGLAGPWAGGEALTPSSWGTSRERRRGWGEERGCTPLSAFSRSDLLCRGKGTQRWSPAVGLALPEAPEEPSPGSWT